MSRKLKIKVWKEKEGKLRRMWRGACLACGDNAQYWNFGATLGHMLEHTRRCSKFRYAAILAKSDTRAVSSTSLPSATSGQISTGEGVSQAEAPSSASRWPDAPVYGFRVRSDNAS